MLRITWASALTMLFLAPQFAVAGWPFFSETGVRRGTAEYYEMHAADPPGTRQKYKYGKLWPVQPRPDGPPQTAIHKYHTTHYWPLPYICEDRAYIGQVFELQKINGWMSATTLYSYHFDPATNELNSAGLHHIQWILANVPEQFRQISVASSHDPTLNSIHMLSVEREVSRLVGPDHAMPVALRVADPVGRPATEVQDVFKKAQEGALPPTITYTSATGGGGG